VSTITAASGVDTFVRDDHPNRNYAGGNVIRLQASHRRGLVRVPVTDIRGRTVLAATLTGHVRTGFVSQDINVALATSGWAAGKVTWNSQPTTGTGVTTSLSSLSDGAAAALDVTTLLQSVANGTTFRGFRISTTATTAETSNWYSFDAMDQAWVLEVELSDEPEQPSDLRPNIGAVGAAAPVLAWSFTDLGGDSSEQGGFRVQVDPAADETTPDFDTGWIVSADPEYDLSSGSFTPLTSGASTQWRVMTQDAAGNDSEWSDWASFSYEPYPTLTMDSPTGGVIGDSTPTILAHLTGETLTQWRARVLAAAGDVLWSSGISDGSIAVTVPARDDDGHRVIRRDDATYTIEVRAWGDVERAVAVGLPAYVEALTDVVFDADAGVTAPDSLAVSAFASGEPRTTFTWHRTSAPDAFLLMRSGEIVARLDSDDYTVVSGNYSWTDNGLATPFVAEDWTIYAVDTGVRSLASNSVTFTSAPRGVWLCPEDADPIALETRDSIDQFSTADRRAVYKPINSGLDISIVYAFEGISGTFAGLLGSEQDQRAAVDRLATLRTDVSATPRLVWGVSIPVEVRNLKVTPASTFNAAQEVWNVTFDFIQAGD